MKSQLARLVPAVERELADARVRQEHKRAEQHLRQLSRAVKQSPAVIMITDPNGTIEYVNPKFTEVTGYTYQEAIGNSPRLLKSGEMREEIYRELWTTIKGGKEWRGEFLNRKKNGMLYWESASISPIRDTNGTITHFLAVKEDITERKNDQERIREQAALLDQTQDAILVLGADQRLRYFNRMAVRTYGFKGEELLSQNAASLLFPDNPERCAEVCQKTLECGSWSEEIGITTTLGVRRIVFSRWTLINDVAGRPASFLIVNTDVTEQKRLEEQFLRAQRMESIGTLTSGIAHDLNNILSPILMAADLLRPLAKEPEDKEVIVMLEQGARRAADIVRQLLTFGRGVQGERVVLQPRSLLKEMVKVIRETFPKNVILKQLFPENLWTIVADPTQIHQVLLNLSVNARDAMPRGGQMSIEAENLIVDATYAAMNPEVKPGPYVVLQVSDTGMGIPPEIMHKIFDPFFTTKELGKGTGLGLSTVVGIVKSHGGFLQVNSRIGEGTQFKVYLPASVDSNELRPPSSGTPLPQGKRELIMVVDDEDAIRSVAQQTLEANGYRVITAADGAEALLVFSRSREPIRAVVTDMLMPVMDGATLIRALRRHSSDLCLVAMSGLAEQEEIAIQAGLSSGAFLAKPFNMERMIQTLHKVLGEDSRRDAVPQR
jgi:PAS domain S-box-containing protein